ncbi:MAG TPA: PPK2 family polyphosphate kinase [Bryobacteraceae bacterium]|nr:PPK2 family polyphosphate kinase [Bryobacteraceae bacterium]
MAIQLETAASTGFALSNYDSADTKGLDERQCEQILEENRQAIATLQNVLYAESERSLLLVLQAMDTGGKDPIIKDVLSAANPQACRVTAFKKASAREESQDRFWRFHKEAPAKGEIGVFNRSYFDEIIRSDAHGDLEAGERQKLYGHIRNFEQVLVDQNIHVVKLFLYISKEEQRNRLQERIDHVERQWELSDADFTERKYWDGYMRAYEAAIEQTSTPEAPWYVITSDRKWFRDAAASVIIRKTLEDMNPQFPPPKVDLSNIEWH